MLSIIIINYKSEELTVKFVKQECSKIRIPHKIIIVNNAATQESNLKLKQNLDAVLTDADSFVDCTDKDIYIIGCSDNLGFAKGNNLGATFALKYFNPDYILFANTDIHIVDTDICERMIEVMKSKNDIGIIGPKVVGLQGELQSPNCRFDLWYHNVWYYIQVRFMTKKQIVEHSYAIHAKEGYHYQVMGSFFLVREKDFLDCGMFDPNTFLYYEESILSERMARIGKKVYFYPQVSVIHEHGATTRKYMNRINIDKQKFASAAYYYKNYRGKSAMEVMLVGFIHEIIIRVINIKQKLVK